MASRGWEGVTRADLGARSLPKPSKYRNVRFQIDGIDFHSKHEAQCWAELKLREKAGEIRALARQVSYPLYAPVLTWSGREGASVQVSELIADFTFEERDGEAWRLVVADAKGGRATQTQIFLLKSKWLELQNNIKVRVL
jgi:hypothetical protein